MKNTAMICELCNKEHDGSFGSGRFCSRLCASRFSTKDSKNKTKIVKCVKCKKELIVGKRSEKNLVCYECKPKIQRICPTCKKVFYVLHVTGRTYCNKKCIHINEHYRQLHRESAERREFGGHTSKQSIYYKRLDNTEVYLHSSFEIKVATELDSYNISWIRPPPLSWVDQNNEKRRYYPDFYLPDFNIFLDPKNDYLIRKDKEKIKRVCTQNNVKILVLSEESLIWSRIKNLIWRELRC